MRRGKPVRLDEVNTMGKEEFVAAFGSLFPVAWPVERAWE